MNDCQRSETRSKHTKCCLVLINSVILKLLLCVGQHGLQWFSWRNPHKQCRLFITRHITVVLVEDPTQTMPSVYYKMHYNGSRGETYTNNAVCLLQDTLQWFSWRIPHKQCRLFITRYITMVLVEEPTQTMPSVYYKIHYNGSRGETYTNNAVCLLEGPFQWFTCKFIHKQCRLFLRRYITMVYMQVPTQTMPSVY